MGSVQESRTGIMKLVRYACLRLSCPTSTKPKRRLTVGPAGLDPLLATSIAADCTVAAGPGGVGEEPRDASGPRGRDLFAGQGIIANRNATAVQCTTESAVTEPRLVDGRTPPSGHRSSRRSPLAVILVSRAPYPDLWRQAPASRGMRGGGARDGAYRSVAIVSPTRSSRSSGSSPAWR